MYILLMLSFFMTFSLTATFRHYALEKNILDIPNSRSSHTLSTPRGGGIAFVIVFLASLLYLSLIHQITHTSAFAMSVGGIIVALIGFIDDYQSISPFYRLFGQTIACVFSLYILGGLSSIHLLGIDVNPIGIYINFFVLLYLVWFLNLYNFMDGIDGLAAIEAIFISLGACLTEYFLGDFSLMIAPLILASAVGGFLFWNFPVARIFMGDVGSGFLGLIIGVMSIQAAQAHEQLLWSWLILSGIFIIDATVTLIRRMISGERFYLPHRNHGYQHAKDLLNKHFNVTIGILAINVVWLLPIAILVGINRIEGLTGLLIAYVPLVVLTFIFYSGRNSVS